MLFNKELVEEVDNIKIDVIHEWTKSVQHRKRCYAEMRKQLYSIENDGTHKCIKKCITSKTMLYTNGTKVYNIENDVIHKCTKKCITSKTMLYYIGTHFVLNRKKINTICACITTESDTGNAEGKLTKVKACMQRMASNYGRDKK